MIVAVHPDRAGGRPVGKPLTGAAASLKDPATAVRYARHLMLDGVWRTGPVAGDDVAKAQYALRVHTLAALAVLPRSAVAGLTRPAPPGGCHWCVAAFHAATSGGVDPHPSTTASPRCSSGRCAAAAGSGAGSRRRSPTPGSVVRWSPQPAYYRGRPRPWPLAQGGRR